ncbi:MAG: zinc-binding dehydrogenase [Candidatus Omnitrophica bacterium]|nr:zinc-binding dehydrogenase [Candidatus Omnitrophota bacterium]
MKTKAAVLYELNKPLVIEDVEIPDLKRGQVLVKILYSGVCRAQYNEIIGLKGPDKFLPHLLGHEASAIIEEVGEGITKVKKGNYVALSWIKGDGLDGINSQYKKGSQIINAGGVTTFSEYSVVSENRVTKISKRINPEAASILGCAVATGCGIVNNTLKAEKNSSIAVFGVGGIGLSAIMGAKRRGCNPIIAIDLTQEKLNFAVQCGATHTVDASRIDVWQLLRQIAPDGVDFTIDASGNKNAMEMAFDLAREGNGMCVIAGNLSKDEKISIHPFELIKGKKLVGTWGGETKPSYDIPKYVDAFDKGELPIGDLITHRFSLEEINKAFDLLKTGDAGRIVIKMDKSL